MTIRELSLLKLAENKKVTEGVEKSCDLTITLTLSFLKVNRE